MSKFEKYATRAFIVAGAYLFTLVLGGFFVLPSIFQIEDYNLLLIVELLLKVSAILVVLVIIVSGIVLPFSGVPKVVKRQTISPALLAASTFGVELCLIFMHGLYVKLRTCSHI